MARGPGLRARISSACVAPPHHHEHSGHPEVTQHSPKREHLLQQPKLDTTETDIYTPTPAKCTRNVRSMPIHRPRQTLV
jgi:hypothetical protein